MTMLRELCHINSDCGGSMTCAVRESVTSRVDALRASEKVSLAVLKTIVLVVKPIVLSCR
jgi:hypothetical protein